MTDDMTQQAGAQAAGTGAASSGEGLEKASQPSDMETVAPRAAGAAPAPDVRTVQLGQIAPGASAMERSSLDLILDVELDATVELGRSRLSIREILRLGPGSLVELDKLAGEPADLLVNGRHLARGEVVVIDDDFGIRITEILAPAERLNTLR